MASPTTLSRLACQLLSACLLSAVTASPAFAQQRLFVQTLSEIVELDPRPASLGAVIRRFALPTVGDLVPFNGGEFLAGVSNRSIVLLNTRSGAVHRFSFPNFNAERIVGTNGVGRLIVAGRNATVGFREVLVADARSGAAHVLDVGRLYDTIAYAPGSDLLFVLQDEPVISQLVNVIHAGTGALVKRIQTSPVTPLTLSTNAAGTRLFVRGRDLDPGLFVFDVATGARLASNTSDPIWLGPQNFDEHRNRWLLDIAPNSLGRDGLYVYRADSLELIRRLQLPGLPLPEIPRTSAFLMQDLDVSAVSATVFVLQAVQLSPRRGGPPPSCPDSQLLAFDALTGELRQTVSTTAQLGDGACFARLVRITEPLPPSHGTVNVEGHRVTLAWQAPLGATHYELDVGTAPGLATIGGIPTTEPRLVVDGVPSGVYYVRVRAINTIGKSSASNEVQIVVP